MADIKESPPLFDTNEAKIDDLDDDDEDIFASAVQVIFSPLLSCKRAKVCSPATTYPNSFVFIRSVVFVHVIQEQCIYRRSHCACVTVC